jgi:hypothetical protein
MCADPGLHDSILRSHRLVNLYRKSNDNKNLNSSFKDNEKKVEMNNNKSKNSDMQMMTVCFTYTDTNQRSVVKLDSASCTVADLYEMARQNQPNPSSSSSSQSIQLKFGFPPRALLNEELDETTTTTTIDQIGIRSNERILVEIVSSSGEVDNQQQVDEKNNNKKKKHATTKPSASTSPQRTTTTKRKAAVAATESFAAVIAEQDRMIQQQQQRASPMNKKKKKASSSSSTTAQRHFAQLNKRSASSSSSSGAAAAPRRLRDGAPIRAGSSPSSSSQRNTSSSSAKSFATKKATTDAAATPSLEETLVQMTGDNPSKAARLMRSNWRQAVRSAHEQNIAASRLACTSHTWNAFVSKVQWELISSDNNNNNDTNHEDIPISKQQQQQQQLQVTFPKGVLGRGTMHDVVDCIDTTVLRAVVPDIYQHSTEGLRPNNLALLSPRVYWSILYQYTHQVLLPSLSSSSTSSQSPLTTSLPLDGAFSWETVLTWSAPDLDWKFLRRRKLQLSEKARENLRQQQEEHANHPDWEAAAAAMDSVERAMETMEMTNNTSMTIRTQPSRLDWQVPSPSDEVDLEELQACVTSFTNVEENDTTRDHCYRVSDIVRILCEEFHIHNWRQLAIVNMSPEELCQQMMVTLMSLPQPSTDATDLDNDPYISVTARAVEAWIDYAQGESVEEIMVEICDCNPRAVEFLRDAAKSGTPKELASWSGIETTLRQQIEMNLNQLEYPFVNGRDEIPSVETLQTWCLRAENAVEQFEWLTWYATPL